ncbi:MAG TPA: sulfotransferase [Rubrobacter sp.]|nr:sulfotransferase [Rubrobacter sp.]
MAGLRLFRRGAGWVWRRSLTGYPPLNELRARFARSFAASSETRGVRPENMVWIFGSGRSGSTWLRSMMGEMEDHKVWEEPLVGRLFGEFHENAQSGQLRARNFVMGEPTREGWIRSIRNFVLDGAQYVHPLLGAGHYLIIKEPNGSVGAPLIMEALPESRMIFLVRDPRDVVASVMDGARRGSWLYEWGEKGAFKRDAIADERPNAYAQKRANIYLRHAGGAKAAYDAHRGPKALVRYEDLTADTLGTMRRIYADLRIAVDDDELARSVSKHSWENIPEEEKGSGKFYRKGKAGSWREDLSPGQVKIVEEVTAPLLKEFYPREARSRGERSNSS